MTVILEKVKCLLTVSKVTNCYRKNHWRCLLSR